MNKVYKLSDGKKNQSLNNKIDEKIVFAYEYSNIDNTEKELYYGGKFNEYKSKEEMGKSLNHSDFSVKRIEKNIKKGTNEYTFTRPYNNYHNSSNRSLNDYMKMLSLNENDKKTSKILEENKLKNALVLTDSKKNLIYNSKCKSINFIDNIFNDEFFKNF